MVTSPHAQDRSDQLTRTFACGGGSQKCTDFTQSAYAANDFIVCGFSCAERHYKPSSTRYSSGCGNGITVSCKPSANTAVSWNSPRPRDSCTKLTATKTRAQQAAAAAPAR